MCYFPACAFDTVNHKNFVKKLEYYGVKRSPFNKVAVLFAQQSTMCKNKPEHLRLQNNNMWSNPR